LTGDVVLQSVSKVYDTAGKGTAHAVKDVSLHAKQGEFLALVGPSGCGKSTLLRMIAGLEAITSGTIALGGTVVNNVEPKDRDVAMVFQNYALYPHMSVAENMGFALRMRGVPKDARESKVRTAAASLGLTELLHRKPGELSGGQRQRVALGRAIVREPKVFLFDEPLSNLDARLRVSTRGEIKALHQRLRITTIYVTHDQEEAMTLGDRIAVMHAGEVRQCAAPLDVYAQPADRMVAGFVGTPSMNMIEGELAAGASSDDAIVLRAGSQAGTSVALAMPASMVSTLRGHIGKRVAVGARPSAVRVVRAQHGANGSAAENGSTILGSVRVVEPMGEATDVHVETACGLIIARVQADAAASAAVPAPGERVALSFDAARVHVFEEGALGKRVV
jgi:multiple sugar transport system ATP-binding protein